MKVFKCDGKKFSPARKCSNETEYEDGKGYPKNWITIDGSIINNCDDAHTLQRSGLIHFCSWQCLHLTLFKETKAFNPTKL